MKSKLSLEPRHYCRWMSLRLSFLSTHTRRLVQHLAAPGSFLWQRKRSRQDMEAIFGYTNRGRHIGRSYVIEYLTWLCWIGRKSIHVTRFQGNTVGTKLLRWSASLGQPKEDTSLQSHSIKRTNGRDQDFKNTGTVVLFALTLPLC